MAADARGVLESELESAVFSLIRDHPASFLLTPESSQAAGLEPGFPSRTCLLLRVSLLHLVSELQTTGDDDAFVLPIEQKDCNSSRRQGFTQAPGMLLLLVSLPAIRAQAGHCPGGLEAETVMLWWRERIAPTDSRIIDYYCAERANFLLGF